MALLTVNDLAGYLQRTIAQKDTASAQSAVDYAIALVVQRLGFDPTSAILEDTDGTRVMCSDTDIAAARAVAIRVAMNWFTNPQDRANYSGPEALSYTASPQILSKIMSDADRVVLETIHLKYNPGF